MSDKRIPYLEGRKISIGDRVINKRTGAIGRVMGYWNGWEGSYYIEIHYEGLVETFTGRAFENKFSLKPILDERQQCIDKAAIFVDDVMRQIGKLVIQDYQNLNELCILLNKLKTKR